MNQDDYTENGEVPSKTKTGENNIEQKFLSARLIKTIREMVLYFTQTMTSISNTVTTYA